VHAAGITVMSVTDHDTVAGLAEVRRAAHTHGIELIDGIEITAVHEGRDVHMLGYFIDAEDVAFNAFLREQRGRRVDRVREIGARLARLGAAVDVETLIDRAVHTPGTSVGRPVIGRALIAAGHVATLQEAFDRFLGAGKPAFVPRMGESPATVVDQIHAAGGLASMAHPGVTKQPVVMRTLVDARLDAIEVYHSDHTSELQQELLAFAVEHDLLVTGGSDFHGDDSRDRPLGRTTLPRDEFNRLREAAPRR
jgi:predicted metal-dependent phosphoesterase TrpH